MSVPQKTTISPADGHNYMNSQLGLDLATIVHSLDGGEVITTDATAALDRVVLGLGGVLMNVAKKFDGSPCLERQDFTQSGVEGIYDAISRIDGTKDPKQFSAYAARRIFDAMFAQSALAGDAVSLSDGTLKNTIRANKVRVEAESLPTEDGVFNDLLAKYGMTARRYNYLLAIRALVSPLRIGNMQEVEDVGSLTYNVNYTNDPYTDSPDDTFDLKQMPDHVHEALAALTERERFVVDRYFGLNDHEVHTLLQIGDMLGVTESRVSQIMTRLKSKLKVRFTRLGY